jgi:hypothetical protein
LWKIITATYMLAGSWVKEHPFLSTCRTNDFCMRRKRLQPHPHNSV